jgi:hypothetical protein
MRGVPTAPDLSMTTFGSTYEMAGVQVLLASSPARMIAPTLLVIARSRAETNHGLSTLLFTLTIDTTL